MEQSRFLIIEMTRASRANSPALIARTAHAYHMNNPFSHHTNDPGESCEQPGVNRENGVRLSYEQPHSPIIRTTRANHENNPVLGCAAWGGRSVGRSPSRPRPCGLHPEGLRPVRSRPIGFPFAGVRPIVLRLPKPRSSRFHSWGRAPIALRKTAALELGATPRPVRRRRPWRRACC